MTLDLTEAQHAVIEEVAADAAAQLEHAGFEPELARYVLITESALDLAALRGGDHAVELLAKALRAMRKVARELGP